MAVKKKRDATDTGPTQVRRADVLEREIRRLLVRSGGRCAICNQYLFEDRFFLYSIYVGEAGHMVGATEGAKSPRGDSHLALKERANAENLILLCADHHRLIDSREHLLDFGVERLRAIKNRHEDRIHFLTGLEEDRETVPLRIIGSIRSKAVSLPNHETRDVILAGHERYPRFRLGYEQGSAEVDLRGIPGEGTPAYWELARQAIDGFMSGQLHQGVNRGDVRHLSVFPFARIPLLVYAASRLGDKVAIDLYQRHRQPEGWEWPGNGAAREFRLIRSEASRSASLRIAVALTAPLDVSELPPGGDLISVVPAGGGYGPDVITSPASLEGLQAAYREVFALLEADYGKPAAVDVFMAAPVSAAFLLGRTVMPIVQPVLRLFDRDDGGQFQFAMEANAE